MRRAIRIKLTTDMVYELQSRLNELLDEGVIGESLYDRFWELIEEMPDSDRYFVLKARLNALHSMILSWADIRA